MRATTVKELILLLQQFNPDKIINCAGADCGGYDVIRNNYCDVWEKKDIVYLDGSDPEYVRQK